MIVTFHGRHFHGYAEAHNAADSLNFAKVDTIAINGKDYYKASAWAFGGAVRALPYCLPVATCDGTFMKSLRKVYFAACLTALQLICVFLVNRVVLPTL